MNHMYMQPFTTVKDWPEIGCLMEVSSMFYICRYCVFTWDNRGGQALAEGPQMNQILSYLLMICAQFSDQFDNV